MAQAVNGETSSVFIAGIIIIYMVCVTIFNEITAYAVIITIQDIFVGKRSDA